MNTNTFNFKLTSKFASTYSRLLRGAPLNNNEDFYSDLFVLDVDADFLTAELNRIPKETCLAVLKPVLNELFLHCLLHAEKASTDASRASHAIRTLSIMIRSVLSKNLSGWEVMEVLAGGVSRSDSVFMAFASLVDEGLVDTSISPDLRHEILQLALTFMCAVAQLSPAAYFLRKDLFTSISTFIKSPETEQYTFEAALLLAVLANFHKSDAAKLNPYLHRIKDTQDVDLIRKVCWAANFALDGAVKAYQQISNDEISPSLTSTIGNVVAALRPDRALAAVPVDPPRELFKNQPIEGTVILLPVYEFLRSNATFVTILLESVTPDEERKITRSPLVFTLLTMCSYLQTHATSLSSPRSIAYANLSLNLQLALVENAQVVDAFCQPNAVPIRLCRQRMPVLPVPPPKRAPMCALLDCCVLWLRHNLHIRLEVQLYMKCIWVCYRAVWYLQQHRIRLDYEWAELWRSVLGLFSFLSNKAGALATSGGIEQLLGECIYFIHLSLSKSEVFLPTPGSLHEFIYELVRSVTVLQSLRALLDELTVPSPTSVWGPAKPGDLLGGVISVTRYYEERVLRAGASTAKDAILVVAKEIETEGLHGLTESRNLEPSKKTEDVLGFSRFACMDGLALMP